MSQGEERKGIHRSEVTEDPHVRGIQFCVHVGQGQAKNFTSLAQNNSLKGERVIFQDSSTLTEEILPITNDHHKPCYLAHFLALASVI